MKKNLILVLTLLFVVGVTGIAMADITGSAHDFVDGNGGFDITSSNEICKPCHAPHSSSITIDSILWNRTASSSVYVPYQSSTLDSPAGTPDGHSKLCLSCHDGTVAIDSFNGGGTGTTTVAGTPLQIAEGGTILQGEHPVSMVYDPGADIRLRAIASVSIGPDGLADVLDKDSKVQCSTCHDVHNTTSAPAETNGSSLLRVDNAGSAFCLKCHIK